MIQETIANFMMARRISVMGWLKLGLLMTTMAAVTPVLAQPVNDNFSSANNISGLAGTVSDDNTGATMESGEPTSVTTQDLGVVTVTNSIWFQWTAPQSGNVTFDTIGSQDDTFNEMDTVLAVWTGNNVSNLVAIISDDDSGGNANSRLTFLATAGTTYYISLDLNGDFGGLPGTYVLNWSEQGAPNSGTFQLTSKVYAFSQRENNAPLHAGMSSTLARATVTRVGGADGRVLVDYAITSALYTNWISTNVFETTVQVQTIDTNTMMVVSFTNITTSLYNVTNVYQNYNQANGFFNVVTPSSFATVLTTNSSGFSSITYSNNLAVTNLPDCNALNPSTNSTISGSNLVVTSTNYNCFSLTTVTNYISTFLANTFPTSGTLFFDDFQMNQDIPISFVPNLLTANLANPLVVVTITNVSLDPLEDPNLPPPNIQTNGSRDASIVTFLNPFGIPGFSGTFSATNNVFNVERTTLRIGKNSGNPVAYVGVTMSTHNDQNTAKVFYRINHLTADDDNNTFTLQAGSDYARPDIATKYIANNDFTSVSGELDWPAFNSSTKYIAIPITQDNEVKFNRDFHVELYVPPGVTFQEMDGYIGNLNACTVTILFATPPAGAVDTGYNADNSFQTSPPLNPNPGANGEVYAAVVQPGDGKTVIGGNFTGYNNNSGAARNYIARINTDGQLDTTFDPGSGFDGAVQSLALDAFGNIIAVGSFHSFNGTLRNGVARLFPDGSLDTSFDPGFGADDIVWTTAIQPDGQILIAGDFANFNGNARSHIARLNTDGSLDTSFDPGVGPDSSIYSVAVQPTGGVIIGGAFNNVDGNSMFYLAGLNFDGSFNNGFNPGGADGIVNSVLVQPNGQILAAGNFTIIGNLRAVGVARLNSNGSLDGSFNSGTGPNDDVYAMLLQPDGKVIISGIFTAVNQTRRIGLARLLPNGWVDTTFLDMAYNQFAGVINPYHDINVNPPNPINAIAQQADGAVIIGGLFSSVGGGGTRDDQHPRSNLARLVGGATPGPGNVELSYPSYSANNSTPSFFVTVDRTNGTLGSVAATFAAIPLGSGPGYATFGVDYSFNATLPTWGVSWSSPTWMLADGLSGPNNNQIAINGTTHYFGFNNVSLTIISNFNANTTVNLGMTQPQQMDTFFLGGASSGSSTGFGSPAIAEGENIPLGVALGNTLSPLTIVHNNVNPGVFNFSQAYYYVAQNAGTMVVTVTRTGGTDNSVTVHYSTTNGAPPNAAVAGTDYTSTSGTLTFNAGVSSRTFSVPITSGSIARPDRIFGVNIFTPGGGAALGTVTNAQVEIVNANIASGFAEFVNGTFVSANVRGYGTNENTSPAQITVARLGGTAGVLSLTVATTNGSAISGVNYTGLTNTLTWTNGDASVKTVSVPVMDDNMVTSNLTFSLRLYNATLNGLVTTNLIGVSSNALVTITNVDSSGTVEFTASAYTVNENAGFAIVPVIRTGGSVGSLSVNYTTTNGTATAGVNYTATNGVLTFAPGQVSTNFTVQIADLNSPYVTPINFGLILSNAIPTNGLGVPNFAQMNINGSAAYNNPPGQPDNSDSVYGFNGSVLSMALQSNGKLLAGGSFTTADGVARRRIARLNVNGTLDTTFSSFQTNYGASDAVRAIVAQTNGLIVVAGLFTNFNNVTLNHIARLNVSGSLDSSFTPGAGSDNPIYAMAQTSVGGQRRILIGGAFTLYNGVARNCIAQLLDNGTLDTSFLPGLGANGTVFAVGVQPDGKIVIGGDFTAVNGVTNNHVARLNANGSVDTTFNAGNLGANDSIRALAVQLDGRILIGGLFTNFNGTTCQHFARLNANGSLDGTFVPTGANGNVQTITVQPDTRIIVGGDFTKFNGVTRNHITRLNPDGTTDPTINFGNGADGSVLASALQTDGKIYLGGAFANYNGASHPYIVRIYGGSLAGSGAIQFSSANYQVDENGGSVLITLVRTGGTSGPNVDGTGDILVTFATSNLTAVAGVNYSNVTVNLDFPAGEVQETVSIPVKTDGVITNDLTVLLTLSNPTSPAQLGNQRTATLTIINDDSGIKLSASSYTVAKNVPGGLAAINIYRLGSTNGISTVKFYTVSGTAVPGTDYTQVSNVVVTFNPGVTNVVQNVPINNNGVFQGNRTLSVVLTNAIGSLLQSPSNASLTIIDTVVSPGQLSFSAPSYNINASSAATNVTLTVVRTGGSSGSINVNYVTTPITAVPNTDYTPTNGILTFGDGVTSQVITVPVLSQSQVKSPVSFSVTLTNVSGGASLIAPSNAIVTISSSSTNTFLAFSAATNAVAWNAGSVTLTVLRLYNTNGTTTVNFATTNGTANSGTNYVATSGTLTFTNGQTQQNIVIPLIADTHTTGNQTFTVGLSNPSGTAQLLSPSVETVVLAYPTSLPRDFYNPVVIGGDYGSTNSNNNGILGGQLVWFAWTPTNSGEVQFETIGSVDDVLGITNLTTYLGVFTGTNASTLNTITVNVGMYPNSPFVQNNVTAQNTFGLFDSFGFTLPVAFSSSYSYIQPYGGPSRVLFNAVAGQTYYLAVQTVSGALSSTVISPPAGLVKLNWAFHPSGVFRFAQEDLDATGSLGLTPGLTYSNGIPMLLYRVSETEQSRRPSGTVNASQYNSTLFGTTYLNGLHSGYQFDIPGLLVTVTRVAGSSGRVQVGYTTSDILPGSRLMGTNGYLVNGDLPASSNFTFVTNSFGQLTFLQQDYTPVSGTLVFDDSEMSKTIFVPIFDDFNVPRQNRDFLVTLTNVVLDSLESSAVQPPRLDQTFSTTLVRILDTDVSPAGFSQSSQLVTNVFGFPAVTNITTNVVYNLQPTNAVFNFQKAHYRVTRDISDYWGNTPVTVYVNRMGTNSGAETIHWRVNNSYLAKQTAELVNGLFPLQPGSDYATPTPPGNSGILGLVPDFNFSSYSGTVAFPSGNGAFNPQPITFSINNNGLQQFNEDFTISLYFEDSKNVVHPVGMVDQTTVTILFDDNHPPAGSVDEYHNADFSYNMAGPFPTVPPQMARPGTDGEVFGLAVQPDNKTIVVGDFFTYDLTGRNSIARANADGLLDQTFDPGSGVNSFITSVALTTNGEVIIGGDFTSYNGSLRNGIALLNSNGSLDPTFNPGQGFDGTVFAILQQTDGKILVGGDFDSYNGATRRHLARLNLDGSLDASFDPGTNLNAAVNAIAVQSSGRVIVGGDFTTVGGALGQDHIARLNADGSFDPAFDPGSGANASVMALAVQPDDSIVAGGQFTQVNGKSLNRISRLTVNGFIDPNFYCGTGLDGPVYNITIQTNAIFSTGPNQNLPVQTNLTIYIGGAFTEFNNTRRLGFARLNSDGTADTTFLDSAYNQFAGLPRRRYSDPLGTVLASGIQSDGNVMIGGSFERVGGGESDDVDVRPDNVDSNNVQIASGYISTTQKTRTGVRNRNNIARLIGGATPGPGNIGLLYNSYSINKSQTPMFVSLIRANGTLGLASANFSVLSGLAQSGLDYNYLGLAPTYGVAWEQFNPMGRMHSDGLYGTNGFVQDLYNRFWSGASPLDFASVTVDILNNSNNLNNLSAQFQLTDPVGADQFYLGGEDIPLGVALGQSLAPLNLIDDHHKAGVFSFGAASYTGTGLSATINVTRTNGTFGIVSMSYATTTNGSTAIANSDYVPASGTLSFNAGVTNQTFNIQILNSNYNSSVEKFVNVNLFNLNPPFNGLASFGLTNTVLRIINPNFQGFLTLSANAYGANLSAGTVVVTVNRTVGSKGTLTVQYATTNGTAVSGTDYTGVTNTLQWNNGDVTPRTITISLLNNGLIGANKQFGISLSSPTLNAVSTPSLFSATGITNATIFINNDNTYGSFQFSSPVYVVNEKGGYAAITVIRTGSTNGTASVNYATANGTAFATTNFVATNNTLTFVPGQVAATFNVAIVNDGMANPPPSGFYFNVSLSTASAGAAIGLPSTTTVKILDAETFNRPPGSGDTTFNPGTGMNGDVLALALQSTGQIIAGGSFTTVNGVPENYIARLNSDGSLDRSGFFYGLAGPSGTVYALANQTDDQVLIGGAFTNVNGTVLNRIARLNSDGSLDSSFNPGAGADNTIYGLAETFVGGARKIYAGGVFNTMNGVAHPNLARLNNDGTVDSTFSPGAGPNGPVYAVAVYPTNSIFAGKMLIGGAFTNVNGFTVRGIARLNVDGSNDTNFDLSLNAGGTVRAVAIQNDGRVLIGGDFTNVNFTACNHIARLNSNGSVDNTFTASVGVNTNGTVNAIGIQLDGRIVAVGQFTVANGVTRNSITRFLPSGAADPTINFGDGANGAVDALVIQPDQMLVIGGGFSQYNDQPAGHIARIYGGSIIGSGLFQFSSAGFQVNEDGVQALIGVRRVGGTSGPNADGSGNVQVNFSTSNGTAIAGVNYSNVNVSVVFPPGEVLKIVPVPVIDDSNITANLTVNLNLSSPTPPAGLGDQATAVLTIVNRDNAVKFASAGFSVAKNVPTGVGTLVVARIGTTNGSCTVNYFTTTNGSAVIGTDYYPTNGTITFNAGDTTKDIQVPVISNGLVEGNRTVIVSLTNAVGTLLNAPSNATLTIVDTVNAPGQLSFDSTNYVANSTDGDVYITVLRTFGSSGSVSATYTTYPGSAHYLVNYNTVSGTVTFNDGDTSKTFPVHVLNNPVPQGPVSLTVQLSNPTGGATLVDPTNTTLTILNTNIGVAFASATNVVDETAGTVLVYVQRFGSTNGTTTVNFATTNGTAKAGTNYTAANGSLSFFPGEVLKPIAISLMNSPQVTGDLTFNVTLTSAGGATIIYPGTTTVVMLDQDAGISFSSPTNSVLKNSGTAFVTVVCSNPRVEPVIVDSNSIPLSVNYYTVDGTAHAGQDYIATSGKLVFTNGIGTNVFPVSIINNGALTGNRTFTVVLTNVTSPGQITPYPTQSVVIVESNTGLRFSQSGYTVFKNGLAANINVFRTGYTDSIVSVDYRATNGTATSANFTPTNGTLVFAPGVTNRSFSVPIIANNIVQPNLTVLLQLLNPTNASLVPPSAAVLTILENGGSYIIPAGAQLVSESGPLTNGIIDSNETVQVLFAFRDGAGLDATNLIAYLLATNGVFAPTPASQTYGPLAVYGHSVSRPFTFTAHGTNSLPIAPTFGLYDNSKFIGTVTFGFTLGSWVTSFTNTNSILILDNTNASPYPSIINVNGVGGTLLKATVTLDKLSHKTPGDIDALVVSPSGTNTLIMAHAGGVFSVTNLVLTFDDTVTNTLPQNARMTSGTNKPTQFYPVRNFP